MSRYDLEHDELAALCSGEPRYRVNELVVGLYKDFVEPDEVTTLPKELRERLAGAPELRAALDERTERSADRGTTRKWVFSLGDGRVVETVLMLAPRRATVCVSSQAGCAMGCTFCATGDAGFGRHLSTGEILEQVVVAARTARALGRRLDHVVFMGMGEPFANFPRVWRATERIVADLGIGARNITLSTVGVVPQIDALAKKPLQVNLAVSLHAANDELRSSLVPLNRRYPIAAITAAIARYRAATGRRVSFEWALMAGVNDRDRDVAELAPIALDLGAHVNLIPLNPTAGGSARGLRGSSPARVRAFRDGLKAAGVNATIRQTRGSEIDAACGQLAGSTAFATPPDESIGPARTRAAVVPIG